MAAPRKRGGRARPSAKGAANVGRSRLVLLGAVVVAAIVLFAWFPFTSLLHQRSDLSGAQSQLSSLHKQDAALGQEKKNLSDPGEIGRIAREQYQLVNPGQQAYEVLPPSGAAATGTPYAGDPGAASPATPSASAELPPGGVTTTTIASSHSSHAAAAPPGSGLLTRMLHSLEFWR